MSSIVDAILDEPQALPPEALVRQAHFHLERAYVAYFKAAAQLRQDGQDRRPEVAFSLAGVLQRMVGEMEDATS